MICSRPSTEMLAVSRFLQPVGLAPDGTAHLASLLGGDPDDDQRTLVASPVLVPALAIDREGPMSPVSLLEVRGYLLAGRHRDRARLTRHVAVRRGALLPRRGHGPEAAWGAKLAPAN